MKKPSLKIEASPSDVVTNTASKNGSRPTQDQQANHIRPRSSSRRRGIFTRTTLIGCNLCLAIFWVWRMSTSLTSLNDVAALNHWERWVMLSDSKHGSTSNTQDSLSSSLSLTKNFVRKEKNKLHRLQNMSKLERTMHRILKSARKNMKVILQAPALIEGGDDNQNDPISFRNPNAQKYVEKYADACRGKEKLVDIVFASSVGSDNFNTLESSPDLCQVLPTIQGIIDVHGSHGPIIYGLETCAAYQEKVQKASEQYWQQNSSNIPRPGPRVGGLYHSGTNALVRTLENNLPPLPRMSKWDSPYELPVRKNAERTTAWL